MTNRYINRYMTSLIILFLSMSPLFGQIVLKGPEKGETRELIKLRIEAGKDVKDLKIKVLKDGTETDQGWMAQKDLDDTLVIIYVVKDDGLYTTIVAGNQANKTLITIHQLKVGPEIPKPKPNPQPQPIPTPSGFNEKLKTTYQANPDPEGLDALIGVFEEVKTYVPKITNFGDFEAVIQNSGKRANRLLQVKDVIAEYLVSETGIDPRAWNESKAMKITDDIIIALKGCK